MTSARAGVEEQKKTGPAKSAALNEKNNNEPNVGSDNKPIAKIDPATIENPPEALIDAPVGGAQIQEKPTQSN